MARNSTINDKICYLAQVLSERNELFALIKVIFHLSLSGRASYTRFEQIDTDKGVLDDAPLTWKRESDRRHI